jgi:hypothetical protein
MADSVALELQQQPQITEKRELASDVLAAQARAHVQARYIVANTPANRRDWDHVRQRILKDCDRSSFAETAIFKKPMGGSTVTGLSIRFAEAAQRAMGNLMPERTIVYDDAQKRIIRIAMTDLESNVTHYKDLIIDKTVERKSPKGRTVISQRINSYGEPVYIVEATEDELLTKESSISSKVERQLTLKILPGDIQDEALRAIRHTQDKADKADPDASKKRLVDSFEDLGIRVPDLKLFLGVDSLDSLQPADLKQLREIYTAIKEGETNWREMMEQREAARGKKAEAKANGKSETLTDRVRQKTPPKQGTLPGAQPEPSQPILEAWSHLGWSRDEGQKDANEYSGADYLGHLSVLIDQMNAEEAS